MATSVCAGSAPASDAIDLICQRLDGSTLAIELAASWLRVLSESDLLAELDRGASFLSSSTPTVDERHRSLQAVLESSWRGLSREDRRVLSALSVFSGSFSREAAEAVGRCTLSSLSSLAGKALIQRLPSTRRRWSER